MILLKVKKSRVSASHQKIHFLKNHNPLPAILELRLAGNLTVDDNGLFCNLAIMFVNR